MNRRGRFSVVGSITDNIHAMISRLFRSFAFAAAFCPCFALSYASDTTAGTMTFSGSIDHTAVEPFGESPSTPVPLHLTAVDLITKVFGTVDVSLTKIQACQAAKHHLNMIPTEEETGVWLDASDGYAIEYYGMSPRTTAMASFSDGGLEEFGYFFVFPFKSDEKEWANVTQCAFCSSLLQELYDLGLIVGVPDTTDSLFEVFGSYKDSHLTVSLNEHDYDNGTGVYVVSLGVVPHAFSESDFIAAK